MTLSPRKHKYRRFCNVDLSDTEEEAPGPQGPTDELHNLCNVGFQSDSPGAGSEISETSHENKEIVPLPVPLNLTKETAKSPMSPSPSNNQTIMQAVTTDPSDKKKKKKKRHKMTEEEALDSSETEIHTENSSISHDSPDFIAVEQLYTELKGKGAPVKNLDEKETIKKMNKLNASLVEDADATLSEIEVSVPASSISTPKTKTGYGKESQNNEVGKKRKQADESSSDEYYLTPNNVSTDGFKSPINGTQKKRKYNSTTYSSPSFEATQRSFTNKDGEELCSFSYDSPDHNIRDFSSIPDMNDISCHKIDVEYHELSYDKFKYSLNTSTSADEDNLDKSGTNKEETYDIEDEFYITPNQSKNETDNQLTNENSSNLMENLIITDPGVGVQVGKNKKNKHIKVENFEDPTDTIYDVSTECISESDEVAVEVKKKKKKHKKHHHDPCDLDDEELTTDCDENMHKKKKNKDKTIDAGEPVSVKKKKKRERDGLDIGEEVSIVTEPGEISAKKKKKKDKYDNIDNDNSLINLNETIIIEELEPGDQRVKKKKKKKTENLLNGIFEEEAAGNTIEKDYENDRHAKKNNKSSSFRINLHYRENNFTTNRPKSDSVRNETIEEIGNIVEESENNRFKKKKKKTTDRHGDETDKQIEEARNIIEGLINKKSENDRVKKNKKKMTDNCTSKSDKKAARIEEEAAGNIIEGDTIIESENYNGVKKKKKRNGPLENDEGYVTSNQSKNPENNQKKNLNNKNELKNNGTSTSITKEKKKRKKSDEENQVKSDKKRRKKDDPVEKNKTTPKRATKSGDDKRKTPTKEKKNQKRKNSASEKREKPVDPSALLAFRKKCNELSKHTIEKLSKLEIAVDWEECPLHSKDTRVGKHPSKEFKKKMEAKYEVKKGKFSADEDRLILANFAAFCERYELKKDPRPFLKFTQDDKKGNAMIMKIDQRKNFVKYLAKGLNNRYLYQVYKRFQRIHFKDFKRQGEFQEEEDELILSHMESESERPIYELSIMLKRDYLSVYKRYLKLTQKSTPVQWDKETIESFLKALLDVSLATGLDEFKNKDISSSIFKQISDLLDIPVHKLRYGWYHVIHPKLFVKRLSAAKMHETRVELVNLVYEKKYTDWKDVDFEEVAEHFRGFSPKTLSHQLQSLFKRLVPADLKTNFRKAIKYLYKNYEWKSRVNAPNKILSLSFENGEIKVRKY